MPGWLGHWPHQTALTLCTSIGAVFVGPRPAPPPAPQPVLPLSNRQVGIRETVHEQATWTYGEDYLVLKGCTYSEILRDMAEGVDFKLNWKVKEISYSERESGVAVTSTGSLRPRPLASFPLLSAVFF